MPKASVVKTFLTAKAFMDRKALNTEIVRLAHAGKTPKEIVDDLGAPKSTVYDVLKRLKDRGTVEHKSGGGRPVSQLTKANLTKIRAKVRRTPNKSIRKMSKELKMGDGTLRRGLKTLGIKSRAKTKRFLLTDRLKASRLERARKIMAVLKKKKPVLLFTDEKYFTVDPVSNSRHDRYLSSLRVEDVPDSVRFVTQTKHPTQVMMFGLVASDGKKMPPVFLPSGLRMNSKEYLSHVLVPHVLPWITANYDDPRDPVFVQDGAPCHTAKITQKWLDENLNFWSKEMWPPSSPDLNPLDFSIWAKVQSDACKDSHPNKEALIKSVTKAWSNMSEDYIRKTCAKFRPRVEAVIECEGGYINVN